MQKLKVDMNIGANLRSLRKEHGYTQDQLIAHMARYGVDVTAVTIHVTKQVNLIYLFRYWLPCIRYTIASMTASLKVSC